MHCSAPAFTITTSHTSQVRSLFLNWIPWVLRMSRPGQTLSRKTMMMERSLKEIPASSYSRSLLFKALDMSEDMPTTQPHVIFSHSPLSPPVSRWLKPPCCPQANHVFPQEQAWTRWALRYIGQKNTDMTNNYCGKIQQTVDMTNWCQIKHNLVRYIKLWSDTTQSF